METKDFVLLMLIPIILVSLVIYTDTDPVITGAVAHEPAKESNILGTYSINPSFKAKEKYDLNDYNKLKKSLDVIMSCAKQSSVEQCVAQINSNEFEWQLGCDKGAEKVLYDFAEFLQDCIDSEDTNCTCTKNLEFAKEQVQELSLANSKYDIKLEEEVSFKRIKIEMQKVNDKDLSMSQIVNTNGISGWIPNRYIIAYTDKLFGLNLIFQRLSGDVRGLGPLNDITIYKNNNSIDFVRQDGDNFIYPSPGKVIKKPADIHECKLKPKNIYRFCVTKKDYKVMAYDKLDGQVKERPVTIKFAAYIPYLVNS